MRQRCHAFLADQGMENRFKLLASFIICENFFPQKVTIETVFGRKNRFVSKDGTTLLHHARVAMETTGRGVTVKESYGGT
jgi:hypothetical protein